MSPPITDEHIERLRNLTLQNKRYGTRESRRSFKLKASVSGHPSFVTKCKVKQSGVTVAEGEGTNACNEALDNFEELVKNH